MGHIIFLGHIKIDPSKTEAIAKMPLPRSVNELHRFLGMVNYLGKFVPTLAEHTTPLRHLLKKDVVFEVQKSQLDTIEILKTLVTSAPCLKIFDSKLPTRLKIDTSSVGLGIFLNKTTEPWITKSGTLLANHRKLYGTTKKHEGQIEKETLSIVFGVKRFHFEYLYGLRFIVINDHKPLKSKTCQFETPLADTT